MYCMHLEDVFSKVGQLVTCHQLLYNSLLRHSDVLGISDSVISPHRPTWFSVLFVDGL